MSTQSSQWPALPWNEWAATADTLHMWTQIVGKTRLALTPLQNHWWNVPLYVTAHGLGTSAMPCGGDVLDIEFDFLTHHLHLRHGSGPEASLPLRAQSVASFYKKYLVCLDSLGVDVRINPMPVEVPNPIRFDLDTVHDAYDPVYAQRFWRVLVDAERIFKRFGTGFLGKISPVHFFWGSFDLAVTRFSGRPAPPREGADGIQREAYSHEVISAGFWPGNGGYGAAAFYAYAAPVPEGLGQVAIRPRAAGWDATLGEFIFKYDALLAETSPDVALMEFLTSTYEAAADLAKWDRSTLERQ
ncbi:hypothetical protein GCM10011507_21720 [Edaphobacter acidisoli]|uniref:Ava_C0101 and related proteins n=1 Tax=Edaphobacter acidisoli TaxID=2040573 RepID=A0A916RT24_9BACT|nr:DUF5996 family protein [Edaphobacter acidisoli]GGA69829.1 hypothetical protein GCM10011507_21720 [Edaphobacter acidisoli]